MYSKLQYISQGSTESEQLSHIKAALEAGCDWIQLRFKNADLDTFKKTAEKAQQLCKSHKAVFIINDHVALAKALEADGVHIGLDDMPVAKAREILGANKIIGGTANTLAHVLQRVEERCDYIGLGPLRFTATKEKLSPVLGVEGYRSIMNELNQKQIDTPVYAIGGIVAEDIESLMDTGVHGIAVSGIITNHPQKKELVTQLNHHLHANTQHSR